MQGHGMPCLYRIFGCRGKACLALALLADDPGGDDRIGAYTSFFSEQKTARGGTK
jgi:hypothetical protein